jgi:amidohydrolase
MVLTDSNFTKWLIGVRRDFHMHPETAFQETRSTGKIMSILGELGVQNHGFDDMTGAVGLIGGRRPGNTIALRADIDALPIQEMNPVPYRSSRGGLMHACGHDANTAIMLGVARKIRDSDLSQQMRGNVKFLFQPAEERGGGAKKMIERGVLENPSVDRIIAGHMEPQLEVGNVGIYRDRGYASADRFRLVIRGKGGHGGRPHQTEDPIVAGAHFVTALQSVVGRNIDPVEAAVITVGKFAAGEASNVIPAYAELEGTIRALSKPVREILWQRILEIKEGVEKTFRVKCDLELSEGYPACTNDKEVSAFLYEISTDLLGPQKVQFLPPTTGAEDFAYFALERPSAIMKLGCGNKAKGFVNPLHSPFFDIAEEVLMVGVEVFTEAVCRYLS